MSVERKPTKADVIRAVSEFDQIGKKSFLKKYERDHDASRWLVRIGGKLYPMKAIWVASHEPPPDPSKKDYLTGILQLRDLGFIDIVAVGEEERLVIRRPTRESILRAMVEIREIGTEAFLEKYGYDFEVDRTCISEAGFNYPARAIFAASHEPPARPRHLENRHAVPHLLELGFKILRRTKPRSFQPVQRRTVLEGSYAIREMKFIRRNRSVVEQAKAQRVPLRCEGCNFDFEARYGEHGRGFIEAHHIEPLFKRAGIDAPTGVDDFTMLCANCHRMVHHGPDSLTIEELRAIIRPD